MEVHPPTDSGLVDAELASDRSDHPTGLNHRPHGLVPISGLHSPGTVFRLMQIHSYELSTVRVKAGFHIWPTVLAEGFTYGDAQLGRVKRRLD